MKLVLALLTFLGLMAFAAAENKTSVKKTKTFGGKISQTKALSLDEVMANFKKYEGKTIVMEATPEKVCEKKGCWMVLDDGKHKVRTLFKDYGFFVPKDIVGQKVRVQGIMAQKKVSAATRRHYMKDAGAKARDIKKIISSEMQYQFTADAVEIL